MSYCNQKSGVFRNDFYLSAWVVFDSLASCLCIKNAAQGGGFTFSQIIQSNRCSSLSVQLFILLPKAKFCSNSHHLNSFKVRQIVFCVSRSISGVRGIILITRTSIGSSETKMRCDFDCRRSVLRVSPPSLNGNERKWETLLIFLDVTTKDTESKAFNLCCSKRFV